MAAMHAQGHADTPIATPRHPATSPCSKRHHNKPWTFMQGVATWRARLGACAARAANHHLTLPRSTPERSAPLLGHEPTEARRRTCCREVQQPHARVSNCWASSHSTCVLSRGPGSGQRTCFAPRSATRPRAIGWLPAMRRTRWSAAAPSMRPFCSRTLPTRPRLHAVAPRKAQ